MKTAYHIQTPGMYPIQAARAIDGDTIECCVTLPFDTIVIKRIRLAAWWAPEMHGPNAAAGQAAQQMLQAFLKENVCFIHSRSERKDKYGRVIATLFCNGKAVLPGDVIGVFSLTEAQHKADADASRQRRAKQELGLL